MARHKNTDWNLLRGQKQPDGATVHSWHTINNSLLMDLRDELQKLNGLLCCANFLRIPAKLDRIGRNTERKKAK